MRLAVLLATVLFAAAAGRAAAQQPTFPEQVDIRTRLDMLRAQQDLAARQAVVQQNELSVLEARQRTDEALANLQAQTAAPSAPPALPASGALPHIDVSRLASIPDAKLAESNARVRAAAENQP